eukprot:9486815-Pyramimonas_sp.AAC.2
MALALTLVSRRVQRGRTTRCSCFPTLLRALCPSCGRGYGGAAAVRHGHDGGKESRGGGTAHTEKLGLPLGAYRPAPASR